MLKENLSRVRGWQGCSLVFMSCLEWAGASPACGSGGDAHYRFPEGGSPRRLSPVSNSPRPVNSITPPAGECVGQLLTRKGAKQRKELALLKSPAFRSSSMALINCSGLLIGWEKGDGGGDCLSDTNPACAPITHTQTPSTAHTCLDAFL